MLTEDEVVKLTSDWLKARGWTITKLCFGTAKGDDIEAEDQAHRRLCIECKGSISPKKQEFSGNYVWRQCGGALLNTIRAIESPNQDKLFGIALPATKDYLFFFQDLGDFCKRNSIFVFWISTESNDKIAVDVWEPFKLF